MTQTVTEMSAEQKSIADVLKTVVHDPESDEHIAVLKKLLTEKFGTELDKAAHAIFSPHVDTSPAQDDEGQHRIGVSTSRVSASASNSWWGKATWENCIGQQKCYPKEIRKVKNLEEVVRAVQEAHQQGITLRAVGSGHSFSDVAPVFKDGLLLDPHDMCKVLDIHAGLLNNPDCAATLFAVESGITIERLNVALWEKNLALQNMGAYDGQTLAGAISTGTHGTGISLGPIASSVRAVVLVSESGTVYHIEPSQGISDPDKFKSTVTDRVLMQDDDWFNTALVAMGSIGVIYSYVLEVREAYWLTEVREMGTWEVEKEKLRFPTTGELPAVLKDNRHYEIDINPYDVDGKHSCIIQTKNFATENKKSGGRGIANWIAGILASCPLAGYWLVKMLNFIPKVSPEIINKALSALVHGPYTDKSYIILDLGPVDNAKAMAIEFSYPADEHLVDAIDELLDIFKDEAEKHSWYLAGPVALRFVAAADAFLAPQHGRLTCMVELDMLVGIHSGNQLLLAMIQRVQAKNPEVRVHWGLDLDTVDNESVTKLYEEFPKWLNVYSKLNTSGMFNSPLTKRLGISN